MRVKRASLHHPMAKSASHHLIWTPNVPASWISRRELLSADRFNVESALRVPFFSMVVVSSSMSATPESRFSAVEFGREALRDAFCLSSSPSILRLSISSISHTLSFRSSQNLVRSCSFRALKTMRTLLSTR